LEKETDKKPADTAQPEPSPAPEPTEEKGGRQKRKDKEPKGSGARLAALEQEAENLKKELAEQKDAYQRMLAEYANYKRRTEQEKEQIGLYTKADLLKQLLPTIDNLERAVDAPPGDEYKTGVDMTIRQFHEALTAMGLEEIPAEQQPFDPEVHHAVMREDADGVEPDTVTEVYQKGYRVAGRVLRPAMVKVAN
jgi:molecular chaperone GrpE